MLRSAFILAIALTLATAMVFARQGVVRNLYTVPNTTFVEQPAGESVVTVNDTSGSISSVQAAIDNARSANPGNVIVIHLLRGAIYSVSSAGLVLGSHECLVAEGAVIQAANASVTVPLITIASGSINVSVAGGTLDGQGANIQGIFAPAASRVNIDKVVVKNFGSDGISLNGNGNSAFDNEMTVTRSDVSGSSAAGIHIQNSTQTTVLDNNCHNNATGIQVSAAWANIANNTCHNNTTGIDIAGGNDNVVANNTCDNNGTGIHAGGTKGMIVSNAMGGNSTAGISSTGSSNNFIDNLFTSGNAVNFTSGGTTDNIVAYKAPISASGQNYFYPPLIDNQHTTATIVNGMGRTDLTIGSTTIDDVQNQYNAARSANPNNVIVLHLNGTFTVGATPLSLSSNTSVLLNGTIQINSSTTASAAIAAAASGEARISISGGIIDGGGLTGHNGISISGAAMVQVDSTTLQNFGASSPRVGGSDVIHLSGGSTPYIVTRCTINGGAARGIWLQLSGQKSLISDNEVTNVNQDGVDCDSSTFGSVVKFNYCHDLVRYGVFFEQSAKNNLALGNICNNDGRDINVYNNDVNARPATQFNSIISNSLMGNNGIRNGSTGNTATVTSHNFFFNNTVINASIQSQLNGTENYYSQNYLSGGTLSTAGVETFFNSADVSGNLQIHDTNSGLAVVVQSASTADGAAVVTAQPSSLGNGTNDDEWQFIPTSNGFYRVVNGNSGLVMAVQGASSSSSAPVIQTAYTAGSTFNDEWLIQPDNNGLYNFVNRLSGLLLDVPSGSTTAGTQLIQFASNGGANQQFSLVEDSPATAVQGFTLSATPASQSVVAGNSISYTATVNPTNGFNGTVSLSVSGLPAGATGTFNPTSVSGSGSSTLTISTSTSTTPGTYTLTISGASGSLSNSTTVTLIVTAPPDFAISATPSSQNILPGGSASYTASVSPLNGYTGTVSFTASGLPAGATVSFNPLSVTGGSGLSTVTVSTASTTAAGNYTIIITGTDSSASLTHSATVTLVVTDFSLTATPSSQTVAANGSTTYTAIVSSLNGFTGTVNLSVSGLPGGTTTSFNPASISGGSGSSTLTVSTGCSTPAGTYPLTITGTSGSLSHSASVTLVVNSAASDFTIGASPSSSTVTAGTGTSYTASVGAVGCFLGTVNLSVSGLPSGATGTLNPTSISGSGSSTLNVSTSTTASTGTFTLTITGTSGSLTHSSTVSLTINPSSGLPSGWSDTDIGSPTITGSASFSSGTFTVNGSGADIYGTSDQFNYASQSLAGDISIKARVASQQNTNLWAKSGVMIRETTAANSSFVHVFITPGHGVNMQYRSGTGTSGVQLAQIAGPVAPYWVRLVRSGSTFTGFSSADGVTWTQVGTISVTMASGVQAGLSVTSHNTAALNTSTFGNVSVSTPAPDFSLSASPSSQSVTVGASTSYTVTLTPINGFTGTVSLSVSGLPAGASGAFNPSSIAGGAGSSTLNVTTSGSTPAGTYTLTITGTSGSVSHFATTTLVVNTACVTGSAGDGWHNTALASAQTGTFTAQYDVTPSASPLNAVVALSQGAQTAYTGFATLTRFNPSGDIDARNGGAYAALSTIPFSGGVTYHFRLVINVPSHTYSIFVTPAGGTELTVGTDFAFRTEQSGVTALDWWGVNVNASNPGSLTTCNFTTQ